MISWLMAVMTALLIVVICLLVFILALLCHVLSDYKCRGTRFSAGPRKTEMMVGHQYWEDGGHRDARK